MSERVISCQFKNDRLQCAYDGASDYRSICLVHGGKIGIGPDRDELLDIVKAEDVTIATLTAERDAALAEAGRLRGALKHYGGVHLEDHGVCVACSLDERLNDEAADWPCWYTLLMDSATTPPAASERREAEVRPRDIGVVRDLVRTVHGVSERKWIDSAKHEECWCGDQWDSSFDGHRHECKAVRDALAALDAAPGEAAECK